MDVVRISSDSNIRKQSHGSSVIRHYSFVVIHELFEGRGEENPAIFVKYANGLRPILTTVFIELTKESMDCILCLRNTSEKVSPKRT